MIQFSYSRRAIGCVLGVCLGLLAALPVQADSRLPRGWSQWQDATGRTYYQRPDGTSTWNRPPPRPGFIKAAPLPPGWKEWTTPEGKVYYQRPDGSTTWVAPPQPTPGGIVGDTGTGIEMDPEDVWGEEGTLTLTRYYTTPINWADEFTIGGELEYRFSGFFLSDEFSGERVWNDLIFELYNDWRWGSVVRTYGKMELTGFMPQSEPRVRIIPEEGYLDLYMGPVDFRGGWQIYAWGAADLYNPTDRINQRDYTDILNYEKEGILSVKLGVAFGNWSLEGFWIPLPVESLLPKPGYRFFPTPPLGEDLGFDVITDLVDLKPEKSLKNPQAGGRLRGTAGRFDLSFSYFYGLSTVPDQEIDVGPFDPIDNSVTITVTEVFTREQTVGANIATTVGPVALHLETAAIFPQDTGFNIGSADQFRFNYVIGGNYIAYDIIGKHDLRFFLDFTQELHKGEKSTNLERIFQLSLLGDIEYLFSEDIRLIFSWAYNFDDTDYVLRPRFEWDFVEGVSLIAGFDIINGPVGSFFGQFDRDDRGYLWLKYLF